MTEKCFLHSSQIGYPFFWLQITYIDISRLPINAENQQRGQENANQKNALL